MPTSLQARAERQFDRRDDLRVLFLFDAEEEHREEMDAWDHETIRHVEATDPTFALIYRLEHEWEGEKVLLYARHSRPRNMNQYPLSDLLVANAELTVDRAAERADELGLQGEQARLVDRYYKGDLQYKNRREFLEPILTPGRLTEKSLQRGLAAYYLDLFSSAPTSIDPLIAGIFIRAQDADGFEDYREDCEERGLTERLGRLFAQRFALDRVDFSRDTVRIAAQKLKYNLLIQHLTAVSPEDGYYRKLSIEETSLLTQMRSLVRQWQAHPDLSVSHEEVLEALAPEVDETDLMEAYGADATYGYLTPTLRQERIRQAASLLPEQPSKSRETVQDLRESSDSAAAAAAAAETVWHMGSFYKTLRDHPTLELSSAADFVRAYTEDLYPCDTHYRKAVAAYRAVRGEHPAYRDILETAFQQFLHTYPSEFVQPLNTAWQRCLQEDPASVRSLRAQPLHTFYRSYLGENAPKTAVIISDGLRYEVAAELSGRLQRDKRKQSDLGALMAPIPSITSLGKASLLPHGSLRIERGEFVADGQRTEGTRNREGVLQATREDARALRFEDIRDLQTAEGRELFKESPLVYIYHDRIDRYGDKQDTENETPEAVERALSELESFIQTLNNWNVYRVLVTADHGFLYSDLVTEAMVESFPEAREPSGDETVIRRNRSIVAPSIPGEEGYRFPLRDVSNVESEWTVAVPRAANRYKLSGAGKKYAHGGASLQELVVPVVEVRKGRKDKAEKVDVRLVTKKNVITSGLLKAKLIQAQSVSKQKRPRRLEVGLYDDAGELVSSTEKNLSLDAASADPTARTQTVKLELTAEANDLHACHLRAYDTDDINRLNPVVDRRFTIERLFEQDDFF